MNVKVNLMKNLILIPILFLTISSMAFANNNPVVPTKIIHAEDVTVTVNNNYKNLFKVAALTKDLNSLEFVTNENVQFVQIFNESGVVEFQLPVDSKNVRINKSFFESGKYKLGFKIDNDKDLYFAEVKLK